jgi:hypothetical protein
MAPIMLTTLLIAVGAFTLLYCYLVALRLRVGRVEERAVGEALSPRMGPLGGRHPAEPEERAVPGA